MRIAINFIPKRQTGDYWRPKLCNNCESCLHYRSPMIVWIVFLNCQKESTQKIHVGNGVDMRVYCGHDKQRLLEDKIYGFMDETTAIPFISKKKL